MNLREQILNQLEPLSDKDKKVIGDFLSQMYLKKPSTQVNLEARGVKNIHCIDNGSWAVVALPSAKMEAARKWVSEEGFITKAGYTQQGTFWGYKVFLLNEYAL